LLMFAFGERSDKNGFSHPLYCTTFPITFGVYALGSVRRECLDHLLILHEKQLHRVLRAYVEYFNRARPHQGIQQQVPQGEVTSVPPDQHGNRIVSVPVLGGLHHDYQRVA
jgi:putative transposase